MSKPINDFDQYCRVIETYSDNMDDYPYIYDLIHDRYYIVKRAEDRFHISSHMFSDVIKEHEKFVYKDDLEILTDDLDQMVKGLKSSHDLEYRWLSKDGEPLWIHCRGSLIYGEDSLPQYMIGCISEIGQPQDADNMTGLREFYSMKDKVNQAPADFHMGYALRIGLDDLESITIRFGPIIANEIERDIAEIIVRCQRPHQNIYKAGIGRYMIVNSVSNDISEAENTYEEIRQAIDDYIEDKQYEVVLTISAGCVMGSDLDRIDYDQLTQKSIFALGMAIACGKNQYYQFCESDYEKFCWDRELLVDMRKSLNEKCLGFSLNYQPLVDQSTGKIYGAESLCRFTRNGETIPPFVFIPILEESGLIIPIGRWIVDEAIKTCKACQKIMPGFKITINLSYIQILKSPIKDRILEALERHELESENLIIELTESGYLDNNSSVKSVWNNLKNRGVLLAIDDFGTGYSNLDNINKLKPNIIKVDRSFTIKAIYDTYSYILLGNMIKSFHNIGMNVCVEGIESPEELEYIRTLNPDYIQGYCYSKPVRQDELFRMLKDGLAIA